MKNEIITIRINQELSEQIEDFMLTQTKAKSDIIREAIESFMGIGGSSIPNEINFQLDKENRADLNLVQSLSFAELIFWIYRKREDPEINEIEEYYEQHISLIKEMNSHSLFSSEILIELNKILVELERVLYDQDYCYDEFDFPKNIPGGFNYEILADFMIAIRYDQKNNKVIEID